MLTLGRDGDVCAGKHSLGARVIHNLLHNLLDLIVRVGGGAVVLGYNLRCDLVDIIDIDIAASRQGRCQPWSLEVS